MKRRPLLTLAALLAFGSPAFAADKTLTIGAAVFPDSLRSGNGSYASLSLLEQTNDPLIARDNAGDLHPALATSWEMTDPMTLRVHLRQGVKFSDGVDFTADDVVFTINRVLDPATGYAFITRIGQVANATAVDKYTVDIKTRTVFPTLLRGLSDIIIEPKHYYEKAGATVVAGHPIGTGPFVFQDWVPGDHYTLTTNKAYWGGAPKFDKLVIRTIPDGSTRVASLVAGESQIIEEVPIDLIDQVNESGSAKVNEISTTVGLVLTFDPSVKPFDNPKIREAFDYAIDKNLILKQILKGQGEILQNQVLTKGVLGWDADLKARPFDPVKAKKMLVDAGYDFNTPVPITTQNGKYVSDTDICNAVAGMLNQIGVKATVNVVEGGVFQQMSNAQKMGVMYMIGWYSVGDADFASVWYTKSGLRTKWQDPEYEALFVAARTTIDEAERVKDYHRMMEILADQTPSVFLFGLPSLYGVSDSVTGFGAAADKLLRLTQVQVK
ncbi:ABC transporter substrate-binding protein [Acidisphaera sp. L21]|uniref:ABC transporter substrate-binding protein n=1 Tax=Acidisphaera sp. L21 TaxID=1641851 RepID=UPI00131B9695|nr:ABC transporter substrate-binding protein [Acidisphaera sp. L21]